MSPLCLDVILRAFNHVGELKLQERQDPDELASYMELADEV
jgi:hypothetical protein